MTGASQGHTIGVCLIDTGRFNGVDFTQGSIANQGFGLAIGLVIWCKLVLEPCIACGLGLLTATSEGNEELEIGPRSRLLNHCLGGSDVHRDRLLAHNVQV